MALGQWRVTAAGLVAAAGLALGSLALAPAAHAAVSCPSVDPGTHAVSPLPEPGVDWTGCDLSGADLDTADLTGANLSGATLTSADLDWANLTGANLSQADLHGAFLLWGVLTNADLYQANLGAVTLTAITSGGLTGAPSLMPANWSIINGFLIGPEANMDGADLHNAYLANLDLAGGGLVGANLSGANLTGADLTNAGLTNADLAAANLTNAAMAGAVLGGADFTGSVLFGVSSGGLTGTPANLPSGWRLITPNGYLAGPSADLGGAQLANSAMIGINLTGVNLTGALLISANLTASHLSGANLSDADLQDADLDEASLAGADLQKASLYFTNLTSADLTGADLTGADLTGVTWSGTTCPDGTSSDHHFPDGCDTPLDSTAPVAHPSVATGRVGANGWYTSNVTVAWNWSDNGAIATAACTTSSTTSGSGSPVTLTASCADQAGNVGQASYPVKVDTTRPAVSVTGVHAGRQYLYGKVPSAGCHTTDAVSGVATPAALTITPAGQHAAGSFTATCAGAVSVAGTGQSAAVHAAYTVRYGFGGYSAPRPGSTIAKSGHTLAVRFRLATASGQPLSAALSSAIAAARHVRVTLTGPGISPVAALCSWQASARYFQCSLTIPAAVRTGSARRYYVTAAENVGKGFETVPTVGAGSNPEIIHFR